MSDSVAARKSALTLGACVTAALTTSYLSFSVAICCLPAWAGALAAVWRYTDDTKSTLRPKEGALLGFQAVAIGFAIGLVLTLVLRLIGIRDDLMMANWVMDRMGSSAPAEQMAQMEEQMSRTPLQNFFSLNSLLSFVLMSGLGALGGLLGAAIFQKGGELPAQQSY